MRAPRYKPVKKYGFNMTPMIDVVFLLIIFFLVSSHLARQETQMQLELPVAKSGADDVEQDVPRITVNVSEDGLLWLAGRQVNRDQLVKRIENAKSKEGAGIEVRIRSSRAVPYSTVEPIMLACTQSGVWNVKFAVYREDPQ